MNAIVGARLVLVGRIAATLAAVAAAGCRSVAPPDYSVSADTAGCASPTDSRPWLDASHSPVCRAQFLLAALGTPEEKFAFLEGGFGAPAVLETWGLSVGRTQDGPAGFNGGTAWPTPLTIAASFDTDLAQRFGEAMGEEFHASGRSGVLGPAFDMTRTWRFGRSTESFGEDPFLAARIAAREVAGIQSRHVLTTIKHFAVYTQEQGRLGDNPLGERPAVDQIVSERAIREIYLPPFRAAVEEAGAGGVMCSFPRINGTYACEHEELLTGILKNEWGFDGAVAPDFPVAQRSIVAAFRAGLDTGTTDPNVSGGGSASAGRFAGEISLRSAFERGLISERRIADMVMRRLVPGFRIGTFDNPAVELREEPSTPQARALAAEIIAAGAVLLKNDGVLPLGGGPLRIAVIGTQAGAEAVVVEQGSAYVPPRHLVAAVDGMRERAGSDAEIVYAPAGPGLRALPPAPAGVLSTPDGVPGLLAEYFAGPDIRTAGAPIATRVEEHIDLSGVPAIEGLPGDKAWTVRWRGALTAEQSGVHRLRLEGSGSAELWIDGELQDAFYNSDFGSFAYASTALDAGAEVQIEVRYSPRVTLGEAERNQFGTVIGPVLRLGYAPPDGLLEEAVSAAAEADVVLVFAGHIVGEGMDRRTLALPDRQDERIAALAGVNPNTVVVLTTGGPVTMPWLDDVAAVLELWLPGDAFATAAAGVLFGDVDPGGRLPVTFPANEAQGPGTEQQSYPGSLSSTGAIDTVVFDEGLAIGYRFWDAHDQAPLFPFGYGLSYARFAVQGIGVEPVAGGGAEVRVRVHNLSQRPGSEVVQIYLGFPADAGEPPRQLKGFAKVELDGGGQTEVVIPLDRHAFEIWDPDADRWRIPPGDFEVMIGRSSRDIVAQFALPVPP
jgi:beta-glucosidase